MKKLLSLMLVVFALALLSSGAQAQSYNLVSILTPPTGGTNNIAASTTNSSTYAVRLDAPIKSQHIGLQATFKLTGSGTSASVFVFDKSLDGANWETGAYRLSATANGTSSVTAVTNFQVGAIGYLRLSSIENPNGTAMTNIVVKYSQKTGI